jgi:hypothetical protein
MSRTRVVVLSVCLLGWASWMVLRPHPSAGAAEPPRPTAEFGQNDEETALRRYTQNAPRHWRHTMTRR